MAGSPDAIAAPCSLPGASFDRSVDVLELGVPVGMAGALACLVVGLAAILEMAQQKAHQLLADFEAAAIQGLGNVPLAAAGPA